MSAAQPPTLKNLRLEGERVLLRPVRAADAEVAFPLIHERREILDWLVWQGPDDVWELEEVYSRWVTSSESGNNYHLAVVERASRKFVGTLGLRFLDHPWIGDVGYWVASEAWGKGLVTEANILAAHAPADASGRVYNVALSATTSLNELHESLRSNLAGRGAPCQQTDPIYAEFRAGDVPHSHADLTAIKTDLGYAPRIG
ncbi:MAG: GNAT family N-acetyltransferase, partial [Planctomycetota bacterium]